MKATFQAGRVTQPMRDLIQREKRRQGITFEQWIRSLLNRERSYARMNRQLVHELQKFRMAAQPTPISGGLRPSEDDRYDYLLYRRPQP